MAERRGKTPKIFIIVGLLLLWELLYYWRLIDPVRFSHPIATIQVLGKSLGGFTMMLLQLTFASLLGSGIGFALGGLITRSTWLTQAVLRFLRLGLWLPFLIYWPLPIWPPRENYKYDPIFWAWIATAAAVILSACYHHLTARFTLGLEWREARAQVVKAVILQSLFICVISQGWVSPYGWNWFLLPGQGEVAAVYTALVLLAVFVFLIGLVFQSDFEQTAAYRGMVVVREVASTSWRSLMGAIVFTIVCLVLWHLITRPLYPYLLIGTPLDVLSIGYRLLTEGTSFPDMDSTLWRHIGISLIEVLGGLFLGGVAGLVTFRGLSTHNTLKTWLLPFLPLTYVVPIVLPLIVIHWVGRYTGPWRITLGVALLTFFPFIHVLWGLRARPTLCRILLATDEALPFAFVAMIIGEAMNGVAGLGYFMVVARVTRNTVDAGLAASLLTVALFVILSASLRSLVKQTYFQQGKNCGEQSLRDGRTRSGLPFCYLLLRISGDSIVHLLSNESVSAPL
ncbi:MAG: hypothetical protein HY694_06455 [Deltaproteobacteria bacterium]|nr:hypothetical protein [Deltaproteobacteria bacterium]